MEASSIGSSIRCSSSDPTLIDVEGFNPAEGLHHIVQVHLNNVCYKVHGSEEDGLGRTYQNHGVLFYQLTVVLSDLSIRQVMLCSQPNHKGGDAFLVASHTWTKTIKRPRCHDNASIKETETINDFVEPDGLVHTREPQLKRPCRQPNLIKRQSPESARRVFNFRLLYEALPETSSPSNAIKDTNEESMDVSMVIAETERLLLGEMNVSEPPLGTL
jgi:RNA polymerase I-specific transcription initiation factor RRN6